MQSLGSRVERRLLSLRNGTTLQKAAEMLEISLDKEQTPIGLEWYNTTALPDLSWVRRLVVFFRLK